MYNMTNELPQYQRIFKQVGAFKITAIVPVYISRIHYEKPDSKYIDHYILQAEGGNQRLVNCNYVRKHNPKVGGYFIRQEVAGRFMKHTEIHESFASAKEFEGKYILVSEIKPS